jgi:hypothetical protein
VFIFQPFFFKEARPGQSLLARMLRCLICLQQSGASSAVSWAGLQTSRWSVRFAGVKREGNEGVLLMQAATIYSRTAILWAPIAPPSVCSARGACRCSPLQQPPLVRVHVEVDSLLHLHAVLRLLSLILQLLPRLVRGLQTTWRGEEPLPAVNGPPAQFRQDSTRIAIVLEHGCG